MTPRNPGSGARATGLILAGGVSIRFGERKPLATLVGRPLVHWVACALRCLTPDLVVSIGVRDDPSAFHEAVPAARLVRDMAEDRGPVEGLRRGAEAAAGDRIFVAPGDAPLLRPELYVALVGILEDHEAAVPRLDVFDPVRAVYRRDAILRVLCEDPTVGSPAALVDRLDAVFLEGEALRRADPALASFIDINRKEDLERTAVLAAGSL